jgi:LacI family transcriptional regulator
VKPPHDREPVQARRPAEASQPNAREVARRAGVSLGTVSHVLNRPQIVRPALRERVQKIIEECGYRPNAIARSLRQKRTKTIGLVLSDITTPFAARVARAVEDLAADGGMSVVFADTDERVEREQQAFHAFFDKGVDGVIVAPAPGDHRFLGSYLSRGWPVVAINRRVDGMAIPAVLPDNAGGSMLATRHLLGHEHRRIGLVAPRTSPSSVLERIEGHAHCLRAAGVRQDTLLLAAEDGSVQGGIAAVRRLLGLDVPPTALLSLSSVMTLGVLVALRESGVSVPGDVALIGFDEAAWSVAVSPPLTAVDLRADIVGRNATRLLLDWIEEKKPPRLLEYRVPTVLIERRSCGCTRFASDETHAVPAAM